MIFQIFEISKIKVWKFLNTISKFLKFQVENFENLFEKAVQDFQNRLESLDKPLSETLSVTEMMTCDVSLIAINAVFTSRGTETLALVTSNELWKIKT